MKLGISLVMNFSDVSTIEEFLLYANKKEFQSVELVAEAPFCSIGTLSKERRKQLKVLAQSNNLDLTVHASFSDINIAAINPDVRNFCVNIVKQSINLANDLNAKILTIHPGELGANGVFFPDLIIHNNYTSVNALTEYALQTNILLGYENNPVFPWGQIDESFSPKKIAALIEKVSSKHLGITWDIGHSNTTRYALQEFFDSFQNNLIHIHIHDNHGPGEGWVDKHLALGKGTINWKEFFDIISVIDYKGALILELNDFEKIEHSINFLSKFL